MVRTVSDGGARVGGRRRSGVRPMARRQGQHRRLSDLGERLRVRSIPTMAVFAQWTRSRPHVGCATGRRHRSLRAAGAFSVRLHVMSVRASSPSAFMRTTPAATLGACCTAGWAIPVEAAGSRSSAARCSCRMHRALACSSIEPRGCAPCSETTARTDCPIRVSIFRGARSSTNGAFRHPFDFCPTAAALVVRANSAPAIVASSAGIPGRARYEGLDARGPGLRSSRPGFVRFQASYARWEAFIVSTLAGDARPRGQLAGPIANAAGNAQDVDAGLRPVH